MLKPNVYFGPDYPELVMTLFGWKVGTDKFKVNIKLIVYRLGF